MDKIKIQELKIGQQIKFDLGIGEVVRLSNLDYQDWASGDDCCITVKHEGAYYDCTLKEIQVYNNH